MRVRISRDPDAASAEAADQLAAWLTAPGVSNIILAAGNSPLDLYRRVSEREFPTRELNVFALDEYLGAPPDDPRCCALVIRRSAVEPWGVPADRYFPLSSLEAGAADRISSHEARLAQAGGPDVVVLGLGRNGHLGFNEPGSHADSPGRVVELDPVSIEANRRWFSGDCAPSRGITIGLRTILAAHRILLIAFGASKAAAVAAMIEGPRSPACPASFLQGHSNTAIFIDQAAAEGIRIGT